MEETKKRTLEEVDSYDTSIQEKLSKTEKKIISIDELISVGLIGPVRINGINFYILGKIVGNSTVDINYLGLYSRIAILSGEPSDEENRTLFWVYPSQSEAGMWRLCFILDGKDQFDKMVTLDGRGDYVQSTLIAIELQMFINEHVESIPIYNTPTGVFYDQLSQGIALQGLPYSEKIHMMNCPLFNEAEYPELALRAREIRTNIDPFNKISGIPCGISQIKVKSADGKSEKSQITIGRINNFLKIFSKSFRSLYNMENPELMYPNYTSSMSKVSPIITIYGDIYSVILVSKNQTIYSDLREIKLIFLRTNNITGGTRVTQERPHYYMPIALIPRYSGCNKYGVYSRYIPAGIYVCKLFEYNTQCSVEELRNNSCSNPYVFIGDRYSTLFPYAEIEDYLSRPPPPPPPQALARSDTVPSEIKDPQELARSDTIPYDYGGGSRRTKRRRQSKRKRRITRNLKKKRKTHKRGRIGKSNKR